MIKIGNREIGAGHPPFVIAKMSGSGFIRIRHALKDYPEVQFDIQEFQGGVMATFTLRQSELVTPQVAPQVTPQVTPQVEQLMAVLQGEMTRQQLMDRLGLKDRKHFVASYLQPALTQGIIALTIPDKPNSRLQKYRLTQAGQAQLLNQKDKHK